MLPAPGDTAGDVSVTAQVAEHMAYSAMHAALPGLSLVPDDTLSGWGQRRPRRTGGCRRQNRWGLPPEMAPVGD